MSVRLASAAAAVEVPAASLAELNRAVEESAREQGISAPQLTALRALGRWSELLRAAASSPGEPRHEYLEPLRNYLDSMGFMPRDARVVARALRGTIEIEQVVPELMQQLVKGEISVEQILNNNPKTIQRQFPDLTISQVRLLQSVLRHQQRLDVLDTAALTSHFPFPITGHNYFARFIASGCEEPRHALKHLQLASPYFIHLRSLIESLDLERKSMLVVDFDYRDGNKGSDKSNDELVAAAVRAGFAPRGGAVEILQRSIDCAHDFCGSDPRDKRPQLRCISLPKFPELQDYHIEKKERGELAAQLFDYLFYGDRSGKLLARRGLSRAEERDYVELKQELATLKRKYEKHKRTEPKNDDGKDLTFKRKSRAWEKIEERLNSKIDRLDEEIKHIDQRRRTMKPLIAQLEGDQHLLEGMRKFRTAVNKAREGGKELVFSSLANYPRGGDAGFFSTYLDHAMSAPQNANRRGCKVLREARFIISPPFAESIRNHRVAGFRSIAERQLREFALPISDFNPSTQYVTNRIIRHAPDPKVSEFIRSVWNLTKLPGVSSESEFTHLVKAATGRSKLRVIDVLQYAFENSASLDRPEFMRLLGNLRALGVHKVPERCVELGTNRFHLPRALFDQFSAYGEHYRPVTVGALPPVFEDLGSFEGFLDFRLETHGLAAEVAEVARNLEEHGIVAIVDSTNYHPELAGKIADEAVKEQTEKTKEIWGDYVRPSERLIHAFTESLIRGRLGPELANHSVVGLQQLKRVEKVYQALVKKFYGLDLGLAPNLAQVNQVLADLTLHNDNTVLILDAEEVKSLDQYREFIRLLAPYQLKIILRCREPFPGVPQVPIRPFLDHEVAGRLQGEIVEISRKLELAQPIKPEIVRFAADQVARLRRPGDDPLNLTIAVLHSAAEDARLQGGEVVEQDITASLAPIFHLPDGDQMRLRIEALDAFAERAPLRVLGQKDSIETLMKKLKSHVLGLRNPTRPLSILLPGPTGVGKTELLMEAALKLNLPFFMIEGAQFSEPHSVARLVGSPSGYVGPDEGILFKFLKDNPTGIVFIDEIEKMHPDVYTALMNFFDKGMLTAGDGTTISRPGMIIVGACNAAADQLHRGMSRREIMDVLSEAFVDREGQKRPELVRRFEPIPMLAIEREDFEKVLRLNLNGIGERYGFINANLRLAGFDEQAVGLLHDAARDVCQYDEEARRRKIGFRDEERSVSKHGAGEIKLKPRPDELYFDMRYVSSALDQLSGDSLRALAEEQFETGKHRARGAPRVIRLVGKDGAIVAEDVARAA